MKKPAKVKKAVDMGPTAATVKALKIEEIPTPEKYGARLSTAKACPFCKHVYIKTCSDKTKDSCPNYRHLQSRSKK